MDARVLRYGACVPALLVCGTALAYGASYGTVASYSTRNFVVNAPTAEYARQVAETAERCRAQLAREWLGYELPAWFRPCQVSVTVGQIGAGGATTFTFAAGQVFGWNMRVQGTPERILDSVIPHEVSHTIFASYFRRPLPRWADEGAASLVEHESERHRQQLLLNQIFNTPQRIPLASLISMKEYPSDMQNVLTLYAEGYSLANYLVKSGGEGGKARYLRFLKDGIDRDWNYAIAAHYGVRDVAALESRWHNWILAGSPELNPADNELLAKADAQSARGKRTIVRAQSPEPSSGQRAKGEHSAADSAAKPIPRGHELKAPAPARNLQAARSDREQRDPRGNARVASRDSAAEPAGSDRDSESPQNGRREGRERLDRDGWQPVGFIPTARMQRTESTGEDEENREHTTAKESSARRRFRDAKQQQDLATRRNAEKDSAVPEVVNENDIAEGQSPFHSEN